MNKYQSQPIENKNLIIGFVSKDVEHFQFFKQVNQHHTVILLNESISLIGLNFNLLIYTEDSTEFDKDFIKAIELRTTLNS